MTKSVVPNLRLERQLAGDRYLVAGSDEVGRGSLGGPVSVGVVVVDASSRRPPTGLRDSKLLTPQARRALVPRIRRWARASAVGHASAAEIDEVGILRALRLAGERALSALPALPDQVLLDGNYDWYNRPEPSAASPLARWCGAAALPVQLAVRADLTCASVAAASVLAKVTRDQLMEELAVSYPGYHWHRNKGYATRAHRDALAALGPCVEHRRSWRLGLQLPLWADAEDADDVDDADDADDADEQALTDADDLDDGAAVQA